MAFKSVNIALIELVKERPCIWDKKNASYRNKTEKDEAWQEISRCFDDEYDSKSSLQKKNTVEQVVTKCANLRDAFKRSLRSTKSETKYLYYDHLTFLLSSTNQSYRSLRNDSPVVPPLFHNQSYVSLRNDASPAIDEEETVGNLQNTQIYTVPHIEISSLESMGHRKSQNEVKRFVKRTNEDQIDKVLKLKKPRNDSSKFFSSFERYTEDMSEKEQLELHTTVLQCIMDIKSRRTTDEVAIPKNMSADYS